MVSYDMGDALSVAPYIVLQKLDINSLYRIFVVPWNLQENKFENGEQIRWTLILRMKPRNTKCASCFELRLLHTIVRFYEL